MRGHGSTSVPLPSGLPVTKLGSFWSPSIVVAIDVPYASEVQAQHGSTRAGSTRAGSTRAGSTRATSTGWTNRLQYVALEARSRVHTYVCTVR